MRPTVQRSDLPTLRRAAAATIPFYDWLGRQDGLQWFGKEDIARAQRELGARCLMRAESRIAYLFSHPGPYYVPYSREGWSYFVDEHVGIFGEVGIGSDDMVDVAVGFHFVAAGLAYTDALTKLGSGVIPGGPGNHADHARALVEAQGTWLIGFPSFVQRVVGELPRDYKLKGVIAVGERMTDSVRETLSARADRLAMTYGTSEAGGFAFTCTHGNLHPSRGSTVEVQFVPIDDGSGEGLGEIVLIDLRRPDAPLLGFATGDLSNPVTCPCGHPTPAFALPRGRRSDLLRIRGIFINANDVRACVQQHTPCEKVDIERQERATGEEEIYVVLTGPRPPAAGVVSELEHALRERFRIRMNVVDRRA